MKKSKINLELERNVVNDFKKGAFLKEIRKKYQIGDLTINTILCKNNIANRGPIRKHQFNENIFDTIDHSEKAYWLGYLMADGGIYRRTLQFSLIDKEMIYAFRKFMGNENIKIVFVNGSWRIDFNSIKLLNSIKKYGLIKKKSYRIKVSNIPKNMLSHFIRGYFDGDGCIHIKPVKTQGILTFTSCSTKMLQQMCNILKEKNILRKNKKYVFKNKSQNWAIFTCGQRKEILNFGKFIYCESTIHLERKYNQFLVLENHPCTHKRTGSTSKYIGVSILSEESAKKFKQKKRFVAAIKYNKKLKYLGRFSTEIEAAKCYNEFAIEHSFTPDKINKIDEIILSLPDTPLQL